MAVVLELLKPLIEFITLFIGQLGYSGIFFLMILESALIPIPSEIIMPFSGFLSSMGRLDPFLVTLAGSLGNVVGSVLTYYLGIRAGRKFILKYGKYILFRKEHLEITENLFRRYGDKISFAGRLLPGIRTYVSLPAGIGKTDFKKFVMYSFAGSLVWNSILLYAGMNLGRNWKNIDKYSVYLDVAAVLSVAIFVVWFVYKTKRKSNAITK
jgi:membrane protein DedA with SNARE-associated domain